jgi:hypothetical protein
MKKEEFDKFIELKEKEKKDKKQIFEKKLYKFFLILGYFWIFLYGCIQFRIFNNLTDLILSLSNWIGNTLLPGIWTILVICSSATIFYVIIDIFLRLKKIFKKNNSR